MPATPLPAALLVLALAASPAHATAPAAPVPRELAPVVVSGVQPGPRLWKVSRGDRVMWVLGTLTPAPKRMEWTSREAERAIAGSGTVLLGARASVRADIGLIRGAMLLPKALKARNNPDGKTLREVLPARTYARWDALRARYLGRDRAIEKRRPLFAAQELYSAAIRKAGLDEDNQVRPAVERLARRHDVPVEIAEVKATLTEPKAALRAFADRPLDDLACFELTLDRLEADLALMAARANAWAIGDLETMRRLPYTDQGQACLSAVLDSAVARSQGFDALPDQVRTAWLDAAEKALAQHPTSFALLPMAEILKPDGYLAALQARGYAVEAPAAR
jgi:uncharacterized protein YbaP (TraB family)